MSYWNLMVKEARNKYRPSATFYFIPRKKEVWVAKGSSLKSADRKKSPKADQFCHLGALYPEVKFSPQESACLELAIKAYTVRKIAETLHLSPRTVEFYFEKMRFKLECKTKMELIEKAINSDFMANWQVLKKTLQKSHPL